VEIPHPRLGFFGVIDERMDLQLVEQVARLRPVWHLVLVGPIVKIDPKSTPQAPNIHYLGKKPYDLLPEYLAGWDVALMPFAHNDATRFISPTKTPEYLAGGRPVVSTSIRDVVRPYGESGLVRIADTAEETVTAVEAAMATTPEARAEWLARVDEFLQQDSWDRTWTAMNQLIQDCAIKTIAESEAHTLSVATIRTDMERL
jgi:UDP-galactopyranose mutase